MPTKKGPVALVPMKKWYRGAPRRRKVLAAVKNRRSLKVESQESLSFVLNIILLIFQNL